MCERLWCSGTHAQLLGVWEELRGSIGAWLSARTKPHGHLPPTLQVPVLGCPPPSPMYTHFHRAAPLLGPAHAHLSNKR